MVFLEPVVKGTSSAKSGEPRLTSRFCNEGDVQSTHRRPKAYRYIVSFEWHANHSTRLQVPHSHSPIKRSRNAKGHVRRLSNKTTSAEALDTERQDWETNHHH